MFPLISSTSNVKDLSKIKGQRLLTQEEITWLNLPAAVAAALSGDVPDTTGGVAGVGGMSYFWSCSK